MKQKLSRLVLPLSVLMLAGCATQPPEPVSLRLTSDRVRVGLSNATSCEGPLAARGRIEDCAVPLDYRISGLRQNWLKPVLGDLVEPFADVEITAAGRAYHFRTPKSRDWRADDGRD